MGKSRKKKKKSQIIVDVFIVYYAWTLAVINSVSLHRTTLHILSIIWEVCKNNDWRNYMHPGAALLDQIINQ